MLIITLVFASLLLAAYYFYLTSTFDYWTTRGVKHDKPVPLFGTNIKNFLLQANITEVATETYKKNPNERLVGFFRGTRPEMLIRDPELAKIIMVRDFYYFHRRGIVTPSPGVVLMKTPIFADDDMWRQLRLRWTRAFSSAKIKGMFSIITERAESLQARLPAIAGKTVDAKDLMLRFTYDILGSIGFGVACDSINNDDDAMRQLGIRFFTFNVSRIIIHTLKCLMPKIFAHLNLFGDVQEDIIEMARSVMRHRNYEPDNRNDFIDLLLKVKKDGAMTGDSIVQEDDDGTPKKVSIDMGDGLVAAQCMTFFAVGSEASSTGAMYTLHELAHNPHVQEKVQEEIDRVLARHDNKLSYEAISEMSYLKWSLYEAMRIFPSIGVIARQCVLPYTLPGTKVSIDPGVRVLIPLAAYHNDPKIFPEPEEFRPERFDPAIMTPEQRTAYLPFGSGPRACVGERLAVVVSVAGLAAILARYSVLPAPGASRRPVLYPASSVLNLLKRGMPVVFQRRQ